MSAKGVDFCPWHSIFNEDEIKVYYYGLVTAAVVSLCLSTVMNAVLLFAPNLKTDVSYGNFAVFTLVAAARRFFWLVYKFPLFDANCYQLLYIHPNTLAFVETFFAVFEIEALTHVCIERYVVSKHIVNGHKTPKEHYTLFFNLCVLFSFLYSLPPLLGYAGNYGYDFDCQSFTYNMIITADYRRYWVLLVFWLRSFKPVMVMIMMLGYCIRNQKKFENTPTNKKQVMFTNSVILVTIMTLLCYTPIFLVRAAVVISQMSCKDPIMPPALYILVASYMHWFSPAVTAVTMYAIDKPFKEALLRGSLIPPTEKHEQKLN